LKIIQLKNHELEVKQDLANCTFQPRVNDSSMITSISNFKVENKNSTIYERSVNKKKMKENKAISEEQQKHNRFIYVSLYYIIKINL
jgi:hypothetical protein